MKLLSATSVVRRFCPMFGQSVEVAVEQSLRLAHESSRRRVLENRSAVSAQMLEFLGSQPQFARIVGSREDLIEKLLIPTDDLDDVAVEIVKLLLRAQLGDQAGHARRHYERTDGEHLVFRVSEPGRAPAWYQVPAASYRHALAVASGALAARPLEVNEQLARRLLQGVRAGPSPELADDGDSRLIGIVERARYQAAFGAVAAETFSAAWCDTLTEPAILPSTLT